MAQVSLGPDGVGLDAIRSYYADHGEEFIRHNLEHAATTPEAVRALVTDYVSAGADEIILTLKHPEPEAPAPLRHALEGLDEPVSSTT